MPTNWPFDVLLAKASFKLGEFERAYEMFGRAHRAMPGRSDVAISYAETLETHGDVRQARDVLNSLRANLVGDIDDHVRLQPRAIALHALYSFFCHDIEAFHEEAIKVLCSYK